MILKILIFAAVLVAIVLVFAATKPDTFSIERSRDIEAPPEKIFPLINDFQNWSRWAPQDKEDSAMIRTYSGAGSGIGALSQWSGSGSTGKGRMEIAESSPPRRVLVHVDFEKPFKAHNVNEFVLEPAGASTRITWRVRGSNVYMMKVMSIFMNIDRMMGKHFEDGLANLKAEAER